MASALPQQQARLDLLTDCYRWAFRLYQQDKAHIHHRWVILCSFAWVAFAIGVHNHCKKGKNADGTPCRCKTKNTKPRNAYDGTKYAQELDRGNTILKKYGDPQTQICHFGGYITNIYEDARLINIALGEPRLGNVNQIHDEILKKLESMAHARQRDTKISGYPISYCCELETLQQMYTAEELRTAGVTTGLSTLAHHPNVRPAGSELEESNITDHKRHREVTKESTDTELSRQTHVTMMITSDQEKHRLEALAREKDRACNEAVKQVQTRHLREVEATTDAPCHSFKCRSASREEDSKRTREESPEYGTTPRERGRSLQQKDKHKADWIPASPGKRHPGSQSYTPCERARTPRNCSQSGHHSSSRRCSHSRCRSRSATPNRDWPRDRDSTSQKQPVDPKPRPTQPTPTQSPAQKTPKLKSVIQRAPAYQHFPKLLYNSLRKESKDFIQYLQGSLDRKAYDAEIRSMAVLHNSATMARQVIASTKTTLVATTRGIRFMSPVIPMELMNTPNNPTNAELPGPPTCSEDYQSDVRIHCVREWVYLLKLFQYWHDANSLYKYGRPVRTEGKLMLFVFYHVNEMLNPENLYIWLHEIMDNTPWHRYYLEHHSQEDREAYLRDHVNIIQGLEHLRDWLKNRYLAEARETWLHLKIHSGDIDCLPYPQSYEDQRPGNECVFYRNRGATMEDVEIRPENAPRITNMMIEALARHNRQQREARDRQEYQW